LERKFESNAPEGEVRLTSMMGKASDFFTLTP